MAWVRTVRPEDADGELLDVLREVTGRSDPPRRLANVYGSTTIRPRTLLAMARLNDAVNFQNHDSGLTRLQREMIAAVVSATNRCRY